MRKHNGSVPSFDDPSKQQITVLREQFHENENQSIKSQAVYRLNRNGDAAFTLDIAENETKFSLKVCLTNHSYS